MIYIILFTNMFSFGILFKFFVQLSSFKFLLKLIWLSWLIPVFLALFSWRVDDDECVSMAPCSHSCINTHGSYACSCPKGMMLDMKGRDCKGAALTDELFVYYVIDHVFIVQCMHKRVVKQGFTFCLITDLTCPTAKIYILRQYIWLPINRYE